MHRERFAGVMSGTSLDGIDAVIADFAGTGASPCTLLAATHVAFPAPLRAELLALQSEGPDEIVRAARAANALADLYAKMGEEPYAPDLDALWRELGISVGEGPVTFDDSAPLAPIRRAITAVPAG